MIEKPEGWFTDNVGFKLRDSQGIEQYFEFNWLHFAQVIECDVCKEHFKDPDTVKLRIHTEGHLK